MGCGAAALALPCSQALFQPLSSSAVNSQQGHQRRQDGWWTAAPIVLLGLSSVLVVILGVIAMRLGPQPQPVITDGTASTGTDGTNGTTSEIPAPTMAGHSSNSLLSPYWVFVPIILALGLSGVQQAIASTTIASALARSKRWQQRSDPVEPAATMTCSEEDDHATAVHSMAIECTGGTQEREGQEEQHQVQERYALIFPANKLGELLVTSILTFFCGNHGFECSSPDCTLHPPLFACAGVATACRSSTMCRRLVPSHFGWCLRCVLPGASSMVCGVLYL